MPFALLRNPDGSFKVKNMDSKKLLAKHTTKKKAEAQIRLLNYIIAKKK
jgi:hypothetical protein